MPLFISDEEFSRLSGDTAAVAVRADAYIRGVLHELDAVRAKADAADINAEQNCSLTAKLSKLKSNASNLRSSLDQCLCALFGVQAQNHQIRLQSNELKAKWEEEKLRLEKSKNDAEKKYDEINEQNKILHSRLETLRIQWAETERNAACFAPGIGDIFGDAGLHNIFNYLCRSEEIEETDVPLFKLEKLLLQSQNELKAKWEEEKSRLEKSKNDAEKKYDEINEQNKILHIQLEMLRNQWAETERNAACFAPGSGDIFGDASFHNILNYLFRSEEIEETDVPLLELEKLRLRSQLESTIKVEESTHASLEAERAKAKSFLFTEEEFKSLQLQVREMNLLRESNMQLREENKHNFEECQKMREVAQKARAETENLENLLREREIELESHKKEIEALKTEKDHLNHKGVKILVRRIMADYDQVKKRVRGYLLRSVHVVRQELAKLKKTAS